MGHGLLGSLRRIQQLVREEAIDGYREEDELNSAVIQ